VIREDAVSKEDQDDLLQVLQALYVLKREFLACHSYLDDYIPMFAELLQKAETRGLLVEEMLELLDVRFWLGLIATQNRYLETLLTFVDGPNPRSLRKVIEIHGPNRKRVKAEVALLGDELRKRLARYRDAGPEDVLRLIRDNRDRVLAGHLHVRSGYGGADIAKMFGVPRGTAYGWIDWFKALPDSLRDGALKFCDSQVASIAASQHPCGGKPGRQGPRPSQPAA
jgi:hypothetical protein